MIPPNRAVMLEEKIKEAAELAKSENKAVAVVLHTLLGAMSCESELELAILCSAFSQSQIQKIQNIKAGQIARQN